MLKNIEAERGRCGLTKEEISQKLGITTTTYLNYVRNENPPTRMLLRMRAMFGCSVDYILGLSDERNPPSA